MYTVEASEISEMRVAEMARELAAREAELAACEDGSWPRDVNDSVRYKNLPRMPYDPYYVVRKAHQEYVSRICRQEIECLQACLLTLEVSNG